MGFSHGGIEKGQELKKEQKGPERVPTWFQLLAPTSSGFQLQEEVVLSDRSGSPWVVSPMGDTGWPGRSQLPRAPTLSSYLGSCQKKRRSRASLRPGGCLDWSLVSSWGPIL